MEPNKFGIALSSRVAVDVTDNEPRKAGAADKSGLPGKALVGLLVLGGLFALTESMFSPSNTRMRDLQRRAALLPRTPLPPIHAPMAWPDGKQAASRTQIVMPQPGPPHRPMLVVLALVLAALGVAMGWTYLNADASAVPLSAATAS